MKGSSIATALVFLVFLGVCLLFPDVEDVVGKSNTRIAHYSKSFSNQIWGSKSNNESNATKIAQDTTPLKPAVAKPAENGLCVHVKLHTEGMSSWRSQLAEIMSISNSLKATLVEPCVQSGRLFTCKGMEDKLRLPLGDVMNLQVCRDEFNLSIISYDQFEQETGYGKTLNTSHIHKVCVLNTDRKNRATYPNTCRAEKVENSAGRSVQQGFIDAIPQSKYAVSVVNVVHFNRGQLNGFKWQEKKQMNSTYRDLYLSNVDFAPQQYEKVKSLLRKLGIDDHTKFGAIQWRPEGGIRDFVVPPKLTEGNSTRRRLRDFIFCASSVIKARDNASWRMNISKSNFLLLSPLSAKESLMWKGQAETAKKCGSAVGEALDMLATAGTRRLEDTYKDDVHDSSLPAVWDFIIAKTATYFSTCTNSKACSRATCAQCSYRGQSAAFSMELRAQVKTGGRKSESCWPV